MSRVAVAVAPEYGYVILVAVAIAFLMTFLGVRVSQARKKYNVPYPTMYAEASHAHANNFNCVQRAHQNCLENLSVIYAMLLVGGLAYPVAAAGAGALWAVSRLVYANGYSTGNPAKRNQGAFGLLGLLGLVGINVAFALNLLGLF